MRRTNVFISAGAAGALALGSIGMASASQEHSDHQSHGVVGEQAEAAKHHRGTLPRLVGKVNDARDITLSDTTLSPGRYRIVVRDSTSSHNWHLFGNGLDRATSVEGTGKTVFKVRFRAGTYTVWCDRHTSTMRFSVQVS